MESRVCPLRTGQSSCFTSDLLELREVSFDCWVYLSLKKFTLTREQWPSVSFISMCNNYNCRKLYSTTRQDTKTWTWGHLWVFLSCTIAQTSDTHPPFIVSIPEIFYLVIIATFLKEKPYNHETLLIFIFPLDVSQQNRNLPASEDFKIDFKLILKIHLHKVWNSTAQQFHTLHVDSDNMGEKRMQLVELARID